MSKKKNTLKDLDEFLKQQAATIVPPAKLSEKLGDIREPGSEKEHNNDQLSEIIGHLIDISRKHDATFRRTLYDLILMSVESQPTLQPEDTLLINTVLYLKNGDNWKEEIIRYWKSRHNKAG